MHLGEGARWRRGVHSGMLQRRPIANPLRWRRGPVARQRVHPAGVLHAQLAEGAPRLVRVSHMKSGVPQPAARLLELLALEPHLRLVRQSCGQQPREEQVHGNSGPKKDSRNWERMIALGRPALCNFGKIGLKEGA